MRAQALAQRLFDLRAERRRMFGKAAELLENLQPLGPVAAFFQGVSEEAEEGIGLRALFGFAQSPSTSSNFFLSIRVIASSRNGMGRTL
jgi:hypothetical protein